MSEACGDVDLLNNATSATECRDSEEQELEPALAQIDSLNPPALLTAQRHSLLLQ
jgi:hypothetical protein